MHLTVQQFEAALLWAKVQRYDYEKFRNQIRGATGRKTRERKEWQGVPRTRVAQIVGNILGARSYQAIDGPLKTILANRKQLDFVHREFTTAGVTLQHYKILRHKETLSLANAGRQDIARSGGHSGRVPIGYLPPETRGGGLRVDPKQGPIVVNFWKELGVGQYPSVAAKKVGLRVQRNVQAWILDNLAYRAFERGSDTGCSQYAMHLYRGLHRALVDYETWERAQWFRAARKTAHPLGLLWARDYVFEKGRDIRVPLPNPHLRGKEELLVDPAERSHLVQICELYLNHKTILKVSRLIHTRAKNVTTVLHEQHYKILGQIWSEAHSLYEVAPKHSFRR